MLNFTQRIVTKTFSFMNDDNYNLLMHLTAGVGNASFLNSLLNKPGLRENVTLGISLLQVAIINGNIPVIILLLKNPLILEKLKTDDKVARGLLIEAIHQDQGGMAAVSILIEAIGKDQYDASFYRNIILRAAHRSINPVGIIDRLSAFFIRSIKGETYQDLKYINRLLDIDVILQDVEWYQSNSEWPRLSAHFHKKITDGKKIAVEVARSAYSDLNISEENDFPNDMSSEYATRYAMGILAQLKGSSDTSNQIINKILNYLPTIRRETIPHEAQLLVAGRKALIAPAVEEAAPTLIVKRKADSENKGNEAKRQKLDKDNDLAVDDQDEVIDHKRKAKSQGGICKRIRQ